METIELKYFLEVAERENIHRASEALNITPSAISKAIARLEMSLEVKLFNKSGRNILLSQDGKNFVKDAKALLALQKNILDSYNHDKKNITLKIVGPEVPLSFFTPNLFKSIKKEFDHLSIKVEVVSNERALEMVDDYSADLAIFTSSKKLSGSMIKELSNTEFKAFISNKHPLYAKRNQSLDVKEILKEDFLMMDSSFLGEKSSNISVDGWREDKLHRPAKTTINSVKCIEQLIREGLAISYLPKYYGESLGLKPLKLLNCPYVCKQKLYLKRNKYSLKKVWSLI